MESQNKEQSPQAAAAAVPASIPLQDSWTLWYFKNDKSKAWSENLQEVYTVSTVQEFWGLINQIQPVSRLPPGCDYSLFKKGIRPEWEDVKNKEGGRWMINLSKHHKNLDDLWIDAMLSLIGAETFDGHSEKANGVTINIRPRQNKIGLWVADDSNPAETIDIGTKFKRSLEGLGSINADFQLHNDTSNKGRPRNKYTC